ncbi:MAG: DUF3089 domain-containing protein [Rhodospirillaceae bacterium]|jgi:hypothetical protein|nr:DUF3089 domain-containing protein [Rhodospirillaceae bacterium]MBT5241309.1 DUF3089 domain-containing protein [Rhodospirillaceae bacterium]MBT5565056.1 DUF3089 domain-containing protein [Rhodospirillaceae bacterium]MBT6088078.1 DUF3089 domain-containing protein [Rhodospirillaceae bacterium]
MASRVFSSFFGFLLLVASWTDPVQAQFGGVPKGTFDDYGRPAAPDYADRSSWAALPDQDDAADVYPVGTSIPEAQSMAQADVFYIHPTTYRGSENWNQDVAMEDVNIWTDISVVARQASAFNGCCKIYAPRYRQATIAALGAPDDSGMRAYAFAYEDVLRAWRHYAENWNNDRPFIIVSHSQGTFHARRLLEEELDGSPMADRMIAAYIIGIGLNEGLFGRSLKTISLCTGATDSGCVISWNTFTREGDPAPGVGRLQAQYRDRFGTSEGQEIACWNPISWTLGGGDVPATTNLGALPGVAAPGALPALTEGFGAECRDGSLYTDKPTSDAFELNMFAGGNLHMHDFDLFYENIRVNAVARTEAYFAAQ